MKVAIIGGGYAGMAAAVELAAGGIKVTVFEAAKLLGGRARRLDFRDTALDNGLHILIGAYRETLRLMQLVNPNFNSALLRLPLEWNIHREFHFTAARLPAPLHLLIGLLRARGIDWRERFAVMRFVHALRKSDFLTTQDISVELLLKQHEQSEKLCSLLWRPLCVAALNTPSAIASARIFVNVLRESFDSTRDASDVLLARVDLSALFPEPAARFVKSSGGKVLTGRRAIAIDAHESGFTIEAGGQRDSFSHVICALPPHQVNAFLIGITALSETASEIDQLRYQPIHSVWLQYPESIVLPSPMLGFSDGPIHWAFDREKLCGQRGLIGCVISASGAHQDLAHHKFGLIVHQELKRRLGELPDPSWQRVIAEKRATISCTPGVQRPPQVTPLKNFYLAGDYTASDYPATLESAVRSGIICARHILQQTITIEADGLYVSA
ncbi:MAG TPA: hydroxysqualene dehydroxylase HpnE [Burkholderiales bacterium]|jgi:squalene-associated FAD-dependent desaturase|nr:hydroxysqualene dehydroxylase HpnE [Burkholderiales bacterium]